MNRAGEVIERAIRPVATPFETARMEHQVRNQDWEWVRNVAAHTKNDVVALLAVNRAIKHKRFDVLEEIALCAESKPAKDDALWAVRLIPDAELEKRILETRESGKPHGLFAYVRVLPLQKAMRVANEIWKAGKWELADASLCGYVKWDDEERIERINKILGRNATERDIDELFDKRSITACVILWDAIDYMKPQVAKHAVEVITENKYHDTLLHIANRCANEEIREYAKKLLQEKGFNT